MCGESLDLLRGLPDAIFDAVITDPPYSSGGLTRGDRTQSVSTKYVQTGSERFGSADFDGDNRDQRSWSYWCQLWLSECLRVTKPGGYILAFTDWRQLPTLTDAVQAGGWVWRGLISWDKGPSARAPAPHYFRHQCEYVVWGTRGPSSPRADWPPEGKGCYPGSYSHSVKQDDKFHVTGKPTPLMRDLVFCVPPGGLILDPFGGSGTTAVGAALEGRRCVTFEQKPDYCDVIRERVAHATSGKRGSLFAPTVQPRLFDPEAA
ncbi:DNA-methyltransferase [Gemmata sp. SH-PL17]|uniref:DNA-methyltransferase n=1 Tax=Gemmata sp. SH-PL17 TaxID=1630693 RepID=UPI0009EE9A23|nr:DNA methyltransferase [Gemmata sp. SH-PL17]